MGITTLNDYRCECGRLLFKGVLLKCRLEIKCKRCGKINLFKIFFPNESISLFSDDVSEA